MFSTVQDRNPRIGVAIGEFVLDLAKNCGYGVVAGQCSGRCLQLFKPESLHCARQGCMARDSRRHQRTSCRRKSDAAG
ncbi:hypothetical protein ACFS07_12255 [Undibacterium arcticum]